MANIKEAYQSVIEFNKTIISITSTVLAALISFLVFQDYTLSLLNIIAPLFLVLSLIFSFFGIGHAIPAINADISKIWAVRFSNIGASVMIVGILTISLIRKPEKPTIDKALTNIEKTFGRIQPVINVKNCFKMELVNDSYVFHFKADTLKRKVIYSVGKDQITSFENE